MATVTVLAKLTAGSATFELREATVDDVRAVVKLLAADQLGASRDVITSDEDLRPYVRAFSAIDADPAHRVLVVTDGAEVIATMQLSFLPGLARRGALRAQIEAVRVHEAHRSNGLGSSLIAWAIAEARSCGCSLVQLTSDKTRVDAHRFYQRLGFVTSHEGLKLQL